MSESIRTFSMQQLVAKFQMGDQKSFDELVLRTKESLERCARKMFRKFPSLSGKEEVEDVLQNALRKLATALHAVTPGSVREYYALANGQIQRSMLDLTRYYRRRPDLQQPPEVDSLHPHDPLESPDPVDDDGQLEVWENFHEAVTKLPALEREVFSLTFYHNWSQADIAELMGYATANGDRQVRRILKNAYNLLKASVGTDCLDE